MFVDLDIEVKPKSINKHEIGWIAPNTNSLWKYEKSIKCEELGTESLRNEIMEN